MMKRLFLLLIIGFLNSQLFAEKIDGPAYIRSQAQGVVMFILNDNVEVTCSDLDYGWYHIGVEISVSKEAWEAKLIYRGENIKSVDGKIIGKVQENCVITPQTLQKDANVYTAKLRGYAYKTNIRVRSIPELQIANLLSILGNNTLTVESLSSFFTEFKFINKGILKGEEYVEYMIFESWVENDSPMDRIRFVFKNNELQAIIHQRDLALSNYKTLDLIKERKIVIIKEMDQASLDLFLKKNKAAYLGIN